MDPVVAARAASGARLTAVDYVVALRRHRQLTDLASQRFAALDGWVTPTVPTLAAPVSDLTDPDVALAMTSVYARNTQPGNLLGLCGVSMPIPRCGAPLPVGFQILAPGGKDADVLGIALALEKHWGRPERPDMSAFLNRT